MSELFVQNLIERNKLTEDKKSKSARQSTKRGFVQIATGTMAGQVVTFIALPVLSRLYDPTQFGLLTVAMSISAMLLPWSLLGVDQAIVQARDDKEVTRLTVIAVTGQIVVSIALFGILIITPGSINSDESLRIFLAVSLPLLLITNGVSALLQQYAIRQGKYGSLGSRNSIISISITLFQLLLSFTVGIAWVNGLIVGAFLGNLVGVLVMISYARPYFQRVSIKDARRTLQEFWRFPLVFAPMVSLAQLSQQFPALFVAYWFSISDSGQLGMAERVAAAPASILGLAGASVFVGEFSLGVRQGENEVAPIYSKFSKVLVPIAVLVALGFAVLSPLIIPKFLGAEWILAAQIMQISALAVGTRILSTSFKRAFTVLNQAKLLSIIEISKAVLLLLFGLVAMVLDMPLLLSIAMLYAVLGVGDLLLWCLGFLIAKRHDENLK
ncbi:oligosaccharide flippase family protein [Corynebacterium glutamicum]|uniref:oligosaccharide flippase family protein n=1 Tax=Corynebacterium glutamicum TaxID=1718 RepID=UPI003C7A6435